MSKIKTSIRRFQENWFLFEELVNRDFTKKYKGTILGMAWSVVAPLLNLYIMRMVFQNILARGRNHYTIYLLIGNIIMAYFKESTKAGMSSLVDNSRIITKINVPKYLFLFSKNVSALFNFGLTLIVLFFYIIIDNETPPLHISVDYLFLLFPIVCLMIMNLGFGMILSALYVFFRDMKYLYDIFLTLLTYMSAIFWYIDAIDAKYQPLFKLNPVYDIITYCRTLIIDGRIPSTGDHVLCLGYALFFFITGSIIYKAFNRRFVYYF